MTDLAPIDLLLQWVGRVHRHARPARTRPPKVFVTGIRTHPEGAPVSQPSPHAGWFRPPSLRSRSPGRRPRTRGGLPRGVPASPSARRPSPHARGLPPLPGAGVFSATDTRATPPSSRSRPRRGLPTAKTRTVARIEPSPHARGLPRLVVRSSASKGCARRRAVRRVGSG
ncbi:hypothetical protein [Micromonospora sp. NBC_00389]|uniref:hypothetical protein n=1 Tax=Micromonospora sp. NBC_00389 TaxID=2903586 RepID=UPI003FA54C93